MGNRLHCQDAGACIAVDAGRILTNHIIADIKAYDIAQGLIEHTAFRLWSTCAFI